MQVAFSSYIEYLRPEQYSKVIGYIEHFDPTVEEYSYRGITATALQYTSTLFFIALAQKLLWDSCEFINNQKEQRKVQIVRSLLQAKLRTVSMTSNPLTEGEIHSLEHQAYVVEEVYRFIECIGEVTNNIITTFMFFVANMGLVYSIFIAIGVCGFQYGIMKYE